MIRMKEIIRRLAKKSREQRRIALFNPFLWFGFWLTDDSFPMRWTYGSNCFGSIFLAVWELEEVPSKTRYLVPLWYTSSGQYFRVVLWKGDDHILTFSSQNCEGVQKLQFQYRNNLQQGAAIKVEKKNNSLFWNTASFVTSPIYTYFWFLKSTVNGHTTCIITHPNFTPRWEFFCSHIDTMDFCMIQGWGGADVSCWWTSKFECVNDAIRHEMTNFQMTDLSIVS